MELMVWWSEVGERGECGNEILSVVGDTGIVVGEGASMGRPFASKPGVSGDGSGIELVFVPPCCVIFRDADGDSCRATGGPFVGSG